MDTHEAGTAMLRADAREWALKLGRHYGRIIRQFPLVVYPATFLVFRVDLRADDPRVTIEINEREIDDGNGGASC